MTIEKVYSTIKNDVKEVKNAAFWKDCYHEDELTQDIIKNKQWYLYHVKFMGTKPIMITKSEKI